MNERDLAEQSLRLLGTNNVATLATFSVKHPSFPFVSFTNYALRSDGIPVFLLSSMATHSKNLRNNSNCSLLVFENEGMSEARVTLIGRMTTVEEERIETSKEIYLNANPDAARWIDFGDFQFYEMQPIDCYIVAGFGAMGWVDPKDFCDP
jgi:putative heme iron utilization protein